MMLPEEFKGRMQTMLGEEYAAFAESCQLECAHALRLNARKVDVESFLKKSPFSLRPVPWAENGYYYAAKDAPGRHPYHEAGVYYIQEPSAMAPVEYLDVQPGERVLDLCAAPGGKSTQIAAKLKEKGILICNEIHPQRAKILSENIERMGIGNAIVTNEAPGRLAEAFAGYFDKILVDAPCSGEGMFRKNEAACMEWSVHNILLCAERQDEILSHAARMLRPGGRIVYSTCTFAPEENEGSVSRFLKKFPAFSVRAAAKKKGMSDGNPSWAKDADERVGHAIRLFPHRICGEGHFLAVLELCEGAGEDRSAPCRMESGMSKKHVGLWREFCRQNIIEEPEGIYLAFGGQIYLAPEQTPSLKGLKTLRPGLHLGTEKKNRFEPSHALALFLHADAAVRRLDLPSDGQEIRNYLNGEMILSEGEKGWHLITTDGYTIGWGKRADGKMKNHYPKGLRKMI